MPGGIWLNVLSLLILWMSPMRKLPLALSLLALTACASEYNLEEAQYWQRKSTTSALYMQGPKAQQTLHQDIAGCTNEITELQRIGALRKAIPADTQDGKVPDPSTPEGRMAGWETPKRDGYLYAEHSDYHDFETCMDAKGWERLEYLPYAAADRARDEYRDNMGNRRKKSGNRENVTSIHEAAQTPPPYKNLNQ
jgi:hypothetical protein